MKGTPELELYRPRPRDGFAFDGGGSPEKSHVNALFQDFVGLVPEIGAAILFSAQITVFVPSLDDENLKPLCRGQVISNRAFEAHVGNNYLLGFFVEARFVFVQRITVRVGILYVVDKQKFGAIFDTSMIFLLLLRRS